MNRRNTLYVHYHELAALVGLGGFGRRYFAHCHEVLASVVLSQAIAEHPTLLPVRVLTVPRTDGRRKRCSPDYLHTRHFC
jgi:hypothetical protein